MKNIFQIHCTRCMTKDIQKTLGSLFGEDEDDTFEYGAGGRSNAGGRGAQRQVKRKMNIEIDDEEL